MNLKHLTPTLNPQPPVLTFIRTGNPSLLCQENLKLVPITRFSGLYDKSYKVKLFLILCCKLFAL